MYVFTPLLSVKTGGEIEGFPTNGFKLDNLTPWAVEKILDDLDLLDCASRERLGEREKKLLIQAIAAF